MGVPRVEFLQRTTLDGIVYRPGTFAYVVDKRILKVLLARKRIRVKDWLVLKAIPLNEKTSRRTVLNVFF